MKIDTRVMASLIAVTSAWTQIGATAEASAVVAKRKQAIRQQEMAIARQQILGQQAQQARQRGAARQQGEWQAAFNAQAQTLSRRSSLPMATEEVVEEVLDIQDLWERLEDSSQSWTRMLDVLPKQVTVEKYIEAYRRQGVWIQKAPETYVQLIDEMFQHNPAALAHPFADVLKIVAIIEYDFDNGQDKDQLALSVLGATAFEQNKNRLGR